MPLKKVKRLGRKSLGAVKKANERKQESVEARQQRLQDNAMRNAASREAEQGEKAAKYDFMKMLNERLP